MLILGHRGAPKLAPENTIEGFLAALAAGADGVELDVRMTADGVLVVRHDDDLPDGGRVSTSLASRLPEGIPTLAEAVDAVGSAYLIVELKTDPRPEFLAAVRRVIAPRDGLVLSSFDAELVASLADGYTTALTLAFLADADGLEWVLRTAREVGHVQLHPHRAILDGPLAQALLAGGLAIVAWTVDDPLQARSLRELGVAGVISDAPDVLAGG